MIYYVGPDLMLPCCESATIEDVVIYCQDKEILGVDTETEGMDFLTKKMIMFQIGDENNQFIIDTRSISIEPLRNILETPYILKVLHNVKFDYKFIKKWANIELENIWDTMLADQVIYCGKASPGFALNALTQRYLNVTLDKEVRNKFVGLEEAPYHENQIVY